MSNTDLKTFIVGTAIGGVMEKPEYSYENIRSVEACTAEEAVAKYYKIFPRDYWCAGVLSPDKFRPLETKAEVAQSAETQWFKSLKETCA